MGGVTACNWEGKEGPRKVGGIAAGKEKKRNRIRICLVPVPHLELCRHVVSCFRLCGPVVRDCSFTDCFVCWLIRAPVFCLGFSDCVPILILLRTLFPAFTSFLSNLYNFSSDLS